MRNVDKLELVLSRSRSSAASTSSGVHVMSGFRTPQYNAGGGNTGGRAGLSRHMYGDAADIFIDSDRRRPDGRPQPRRPLNIDDSRVDSAGAWTASKRHIPELDRRRRRVSGRVWARTFHSHRHARLSRPLGRHPEEDNEQNIGGNGQDGRDDQVERARSTGWATRCKPDEESMRDPRRAARATSSRTSGFATSRSCSSSWAVILGSAARRRDRHRRRARRAAAAIPTLLGEASRLIVLAGLLWGVGDLAILLIDVGHDVRAARILLARQTHALAGDARRRRELAGGRRRIGDRCAAAVAAGSGTIVAIALRPQSQHTHF